MKELKPKSIGRLLLLIVLSLIAGCSFGEESRLIGKWQSQPLAFEQNSVEHRSVDSNESEATSAAMINRLLSGISLEFSSGSRFTMKLVSASGSDDLVTGDWSVISTNGDRQMIELVSDQSDQALRMKINFENGGIVARQVDGDSRIGPVFYQRLN